MLQYDENRSALNKQLKRSQSFCLSHWHDHANCRVMSSRPTD